MNNDITFLYNLLIICIYFNVVFEEMPNFYCIFKDTMYNFYIYKTLCVFFIFIFNFCRLKQYYSIQNLTELFKQKGLDPDDLILGEEQGELPLYVFDDIMFETRTPAQW